MNIVVHLKGIQNYFNKSFGLTSYNNYWIDKCIHLDLNLEYISNDCTTVNSSEAQTRKR